MACRTREIVGMVSAVLEVTSITILAYLVVIDEADPAVLVVTMRAFGSFSYGSSGLWRERTHRSCDHSLLPSLLELYIWDTISTFSQDVFQQRPPRPSSLQPV